MWWFKRGQTSYSDHKTYFDVDRWQHALQHYMRLSFSSYHTHILFDFIHLTRASQNIDDELVNLVIKMLLN